MAKTLLFIVNPKAGKKRPTDFFLNVISAFCDADYLVSLRQTRHHGHAVELAREAAKDFDLVVCYGGDGTLNQTVNGLLQVDAPPPIGYIAGGSTNDFAASLHLPANPVDAARSIVSSGGRFLDVGQFQSCQQSQHFMYVASFGAFTKASYSAPQAAKNDLGHLAYIIEGVKDLSSLRSYRATITADGEVFDGKFLFGAVANATSIGGVMKLKESDVVLDDGKFEMLLIPEPKSVVDLNDMARALLLQDYSGNGLILRHVSHISVATGENLPWSLDGEFAPGCQMVEISNLARKLEMRL